MPLASSKGKPIYPAGPDIQNQKTTIGRTVVNKKAMASFISVGHLNSTDIYRKNMCLARFLILIVVVDIGGTIDTLIITKLIQKVHLAQLYRRTRAATWHRSKDSRHPCR